MTSNLVPYPRIHAVIPCKYIISSTIGTETSETGKNND